MGNPVRQEIVAVRREVDILRKQVDVLVEENLVYRKFLLKLLDPVENGVNDLNKDLVELGKAQEASSRREAGGGTVQGGGFRR